MYEIRLEMPDYESAVQVATILLKSGYSVRLGTFINSNINEQNCIIINPLNKKDVINIITDDEIKKSIDDNKEEFKIGGICDYLCGIIDNVINEKGRKANELKKKLINNSEYLDSLKNADNDTIIENLLDILYPINKEEV